MNKIIIFLLILASQCLHIVAAGKNEIRASWITTIGGLDWPKTKASSANSIRRQKEELCRQLDFLTRENFNTVLLQVRLRGDVIYPSILEGYAECMTGHTGKNPGYDPLEFAINECHKRGLEIHAWIVCIPVGNSRQVQLQGKNSVVKKRPEICKKFNGNWFLDPGNPATASYLSSITKEIVSRYDIDGIHLDYIRYPEKGKNFPDKDTYKKYGRGMDLAQWRRNNITHIVRRVYAETKSIKPWIKVSSSPIGKYNDTQRYNSHGWNAYSTVYQDAQLWLKDGIQDMIFPMMYFQKNNFYPFVLDWQENKYGRWIVPGLGIYFLEEKKYAWTIKEVMRQIYFIRKHNLDGQAFFRNEFLMKNSCGITSSAINRFYNHKAVVPPMKWQDSIPPSTPKNGSMSIAGNTIKLKWNTPHTIKKGGIFYRIYSSVCYPIDISDGKCLTESRVDTNEYTYTIKEEWDKSRYWAVVSVDRYGNESSPLQINSPKENDDMVCLNKLPEIPAGGFMIIKDASGMELMKYNATVEINVKLPNGVYLVETTDTYGSKKTFTVIITK